MMRSLESGRTTMVAALALAVAAAIALPAFAFGSPAPEVECTKFSEYAAGAPDLSGFAYILDYFNAADQFDEPSTSITVFIFTDEGLDRRLCDIGGCGVPIEDFLSRVPKNRFDEVFGHHVVTDDFNSLDALVEAGTITTNVTGPDVIPEIDVFEEDGAFYVFSGTADAKIIEGPIELCDASVYIVDTVLIPAGELPALQPEEETPGPDLED